MMFRVRKGRRNACFREIRLFVAYASIGTKKIRADFTRAIFALRADFEQIHVTRYERQLQATQGQNDHE
jgi:hypothetical protein